MAMKTGSFWTEWGPWIARHGYRVHYRLASWVDVATELNAVAEAVLSPTAVYQAFIREKVKPHHSPLTREEARALCPDPTPGTAAIRQRAPGPVDVHAYLELPPRPFEVPISAPTPPAILRGWQRTIGYGDTHIPFHDDGALAVVQALIRDTQPERIIHFGDLLDCYTISRYSKDPARLSTLQDEIDLARVHLAQMARLAPGAERWLLAGNHEDRLQSLIYTLPGAHAELARLTAFQQAITWPKMLDLDAIGWRWLETGAQTRSPILPKLITKHGTVVRKWSAFTGKGEWERYGKGGLSGHTHRLGTFYHRDHNGAHLWQECGCTCRLDPEYMTDPDWQQGAVVVTHTADGERYQVEEVYIQDGRAVWREREYRAA